jgi:hypothetical protein
MAKPGEAMEVEKVRAWFKDKVIEKKREWDAFRQSKRPQIEAFYERLGGSLIQGNWDEVGRWAGAIQRALGDMNHYCLHGKLPEFSILT